MRVVVEVRTTCAVVEEPRSRVSRHVLDERLRVTTPFVVEQGQDGDSHFLDLLELTAPGSRARNTC